EAGKDLAENKRILYVAMTRAQSHLIISGGHNRNSKNPESATGKKVLLNMVLKGLGWDGDPESLSSEVFKKYLKIIPDVTNREINSAAGRAHTIDPDIIKSDYEKCDTIVRTAKRDTWSVSELNSFYTGVTDHEDINGVKLSSVDSDSFLTEENYAAFGTHCHRIIEAALKSIRDKVLLPSSFSTFQTAQKKILETDAQKLAENFLSSSFALEIKDSSFKSELAFLLNLGDSQNHFYVNGQIDLLLEKKDAVMIIDFKTDKYRNPEEYAVQMFLYRKAAEEIFNKPVISYLFYLREGKAVEVDSFFQIADILEYLS
ncbi:MAG: PD-(D/E)XK nuclease family protein, partial [Spirochaetales bacterium]|nr:PD-(D/E)XK nuclease family protein [Spirochaetales bacterium]